MEVVMDRLLRKIIEKRATIGIIGLGHTGLRLSNEFGIEGFKIIGFDIDTTKIQTLQERKSYLPFLPMGFLFCMMDEKRFLPTADVEQLSEADVIIISVPTPLNNERLPDLSYVKSAAQFAAAALQKKASLVTVASNGMHRRLGDREDQQLIILQSTSYPGTTEEEVLPIFQKTGLQLGADFFLAHVPEREDAGNPNFVANQVPRICGGMTPQCALLTKALFEHITVKVHICPSIKVAEAAKTYENSYRFINIAFVDEMKIAFDKMDINIWDVIEASSTKPFGFTAFYPGPGIGGECIPVDPIYLSWKAKQYDAPMGMIEYAEKVNRKITEHVVETAENALLKKQGKGLKSSSILLLGVAFKGDVGDIRESPSLRLIDLLQKKGALISYHDYFVSKINSPPMESIALNEKTLGLFDCVIIVSNHSRYDWSWICEHSQLVIDTRNATKRLTPRLKEKVIL